MSVLFNIYTTKLFFYNSKKLAVKYSLKKNKIEILN